MRKSIDELQENYGKHLNSCGFRLLSRCDDLNYFKVSCIHCGSEFNKVISAARNFSIYKCYTCNDRALSDKFKLLKWEMMKKLQYGDKKSRFETRLCRCTECGYFKVLHPAALKSDSIHCPSCEYISYSDLAESKGFRLVNRSARRAHLILECQECNHRDDYQGSNLKSSALRCRKCKSRKVDRSFFYAFILRSENTAIKIGKSNNPYLRITGSLKEGVKAEFLGSLQFSSEAEAYAFESDALRKFNEYRVNGEEFLLSGTSEVFSIDILEEVKEILCQKSYN